MRNKKRKIPLAVNAITVFKKVILSFFIIKIEENKIVINKKIFTNKFTPITLRSHEKVRSKINPKKYLKFTIHDPGFGRKFKINKELHLKILKDFDGGSISDNETRKTIDYVFKKFNLVIDPHTAVGYAVGKKLLDESEKRVYLATAHYAKFMDTVQNSINKKLMYPKSLRSVLNKKENFLLIKNDIKDLERVISEIN